MAVSLLALNFPVVVGFAVHFCGEVLVWLCLGIAVTALAVLSVMRGIFQRGWPTTEGRVSDSEVVPQLGLFGWPDPENDEFIVHYSYVVEGRTFERTLRLRRCSDMVERAFGGYPKKDATVQVYYNPRNPAESVLAPGPSSLTIVLLILGIAGMGVGGYLIWS